MAGSDRIVLRSIIIYIGSQRRTYIFRPLEYRHRAVVVQANFSAGSTVRQSQKQYMVAGLADADRLGKKE
jgi:hypothetical protein